MAITYEGGTEQVRQIVHDHAVLRRGLERRRARCARRSSAASRSNG